MTGCQRSVRRSCKASLPPARPIGKRLVVDFGKPFTAEIVGVVADVRVYGQASDAPDLIYFTNRQPNAGFSTGVMNLTARVRGDPNAITPQVRAALHAINGDIPLSATQSMESILHDSISSARFRTQLLVGFAGVALLLAVVGLYGTLSYSVTQRSRDGNPHRARHPTGFGLQSRHFKRDDARGCGGLVRYWRRVGGDAPSVDADLFGVAPTDPSCS